MYILLLFPREGIFPRLCSLVQEDKEQQSLDPMGKLWVMERIIPWALREQPS